MHCSAVLLAGGKSSRMGRDKALLEIDGEMLWHRQLQTLRRLTITEIFLAGDLREPDCLTIADEIPGVGPLGGIVAALRRTTAEHLLVLAVDLPKMNASFLARLQKFCSLGKGAVPRRGDRFEPLAAIYPRDALALAVKHLHRGEFSLQFFIRAAVRENLLLVHEVIDEEVSLFANVNTPADLAAL